MCLYVKGMKLLLIIAVPHNFETTSGSSKMSRRNKNYTFCHECA